MNKILPFLWKALAFVGIGLGALFAGKALGKQEQKTKQ